MIDQLLQKIEQSDSEWVKNSLKDLIGTGREAWTIHLSLFPLVQRVLNPPFINPHLPKMYRIYREFLPHLEEDDIPALIRLEINEYTRRPKLKEFRKADIRQSISFREIEASIRDGKSERVATLLYAFLQQKGRDELTRNLLLLGSGYLEQSLGHSVSCTAFILLEMLERSDQDDPWPALVMLADYFCRGGFHTIPEMRGRAVLPSSEDTRQMLRATSGDGIINLHHTITRYAIERVRHLLSEAEHTHMIECWIEFMGSKGIAVPTLVSSGETLLEYNTFLQSFSKLAEKQVLSYMKGMLLSEKGRCRLGSYLIKGVCELYQGDYNPHYLTGLGSALWVLGNYCTQPPIAINAMRQYLNYYFTEMSS